MDYLIRFLDTFIVPGGAKRDAERTIKEYLEINGVEMDEQNQRFYRDFGRSVEKTKKFCYIFIPTLGLII